MNTPEERTRKESQPLLDNEIPQDAYNLVYITFLMIGAGFLFPWNAVITAVDYWALIYSPQIIFKFTVAYMVPNLCGLVFVVLYGSRIPAGVRIIGGFLLFIAVVVVVMLVHNSVLSIMLMCLLGFSDSVVQGTTYGLAGQFPPKYVGAVMAGNGVSGVTICLLRILTKLAEPNNSEGIKASAILYFIVAIIALVACIIAYVTIMYKSPFAKYYQVHSLNEDNRNKSFKAIMEEAKFSLQHTWVLALMVGFNFFVTLGLFPGITSQLTSTHESLNRGSWFPIILTTIFNVGDLIGRTAPTWFVWFTHKNVWIPILLRVVYFPLFLLSLHPKLFVSDIWMYAFMSTFAISNGYLSTLCMMQGPSLVPEKFRETAGTVMVFFLTIGLTAGVVFGILLEDAYIS